MIIAAVLGGGAGGCAAAVDLSLAGHRVHLWNRGRPAIDLIRHQGLRHAGVLGEGVVVPERVTTVLEDALDGADVGVVCLPALAHEPLMTELARLTSELPLVLNPGHTCGALHARALFMSARRSVPPVAELSTLTYVARKPEPDIVIVYSKASRVRAACLPASPGALALAAELFPAAQPVSDVLSADLANVNMVLHPPGAVLGAAWIEATRGDFTFYVDGMTPGVVRALSGLDEERLAVARAFGHELPPLVDEMTAIGTIGPDRGGQADVRSRIRSSRANARIKAPESLQHRYYREDLPYGLVPFMALADIVGVPVPIAQSLLRLGNLITGERFDETGLTASRLGLTGYDRDDLQRLVRR